MAQWPLPLQPDQLARLVESEQPATLTVYAPFSGESLGRVPACTVADIQQAGQRARQAQKIWRSYPLRRRKTILLHYHDLILQHQKSLLDLLQLESGKARRHALEEIVDVVLTCRYYAFRAHRYLRPRARRGVLPLLTTSREYRHPVGLVGLIVPWNYPLTLVISDAIPALLAGNAVIVKPAEETPFIALYARQLLIEAGLPPDLFQVVTGYGEQIGPPLIQTVDFVGFTGSSETGRLVARQAGEQLIGCSLELGGKNPMLILNDANLDRTVEGAIRGCFSNAGQLCIACERLYIQSEIYDRFERAFVERTRQLRLGCGFDFEVEVGSLISEGHLRHVQSHVQDAIEKGAAVLAGGRSRPDIGPYFYEPTVLSGVTSQMKVATEETFGPVVSLYRFDRVEEAIRAANDSPYGLNASLWTADTRAGRRLAGQIECGTVNINEAYAAAWASIDAPMGGMKASGVGRRHGVEGILKYTEAQTISVQRFLSLGSVPGISPKRFARLMLWLVWLMRHMPGLR